MAGKYWWDEYEQPRKEQKNNEQDNAQESSAQGYWWDNVSPTVGNNIANRVNTYLEKHNSYINDHQNRYSGRKGNYEDAYVSDSADWYKTVNMRNIGFDTEANSILSYMDQYKDYLDADWMKSVKDALTGTRDQQKAIFDIAQNDYKYWNSFGTDELVEKYGSAEEAYKYGQRSYGYSQKYDGKTYTELQDIIKNLNAQDFVGTLENSEELEWLKSYAPTVDYNEKANFDLEAGKLEIAKLRDKETAINRILASLQGDVLHTEEGDALIEKYGKEREAVWDRIKELEQYMTHAERIQYGIELASVADPNSANYDPEFSNYTGFIADEESPFGVNPNLHYAYINDSTLGDKNVRDMLGFGDWTRLNHLTEDETAIYNYYYNKHGEEAAKEYLDYLTESLDYRKAKHNFENEYQGNRLKELMFAFEAGIDQFSSGIKNLFNDDDYIPTSYTQALSGMVREDLADVDLKWYNFKEGEWDDANIGGSSLGQSLYDTVTTTANMAPSILVSYAVGLLNPAAGAAAGSTLLGGSAAGNAYADALQQGYTKDQAKTYGTFVGASEGLLQYLIGGISSLGGLSGKFTNKIAAIDRAGLRAAAKLGVSIAGETLEEELQNYLEPAFRTIIFGEDYDAPTIDQIIETAFVTFLSTGFLEGGSAISQTRAEEAYKREYGGETNTLIQKGLENDIDTEGFDLAVKYQDKVSKGKNLTGAEIRNLLEANREHITADDMNKIQKAAEERLRSLGQTENVSKIAKLATKHAMGQELTREEKSILANSEYGSRVSKELLPENFLSEEHDTEWAEDIGTTIVNRNAYNLKKTKAQIEEIVKQAAQMNNPSTYKPLSDRIGKDDNVSVSDNGKATVNGEEIKLNKKVEVVDFVRDKKTGKITDIIINANGKQVKASEIDFADADQAYLFSAVKHIENITPADATAFVRGYDSSLGISVGEYLNGIDEAYTYGYHGYTESDMKSGQFTTKLSDEKAKGAYELGKLARKSSVEAKDAAIKRMRTAVEAETAKAVAEGKPAPEPKKMAITYNEGKGVVREFDNDAIERLPEKQRAGVEVARILHKLGLGTNFEFFESFKSKKLKVKDQKTGKLVPARVFINDAGVEQPAPAGVYMRSDGTIRIDLNAYNGRNLTLYALAHELTHFIQQWSTEKYEVLAEYLVSTYEKTGLTMHQRVLREQARLKGIRGKDISYNEAYDEVVANAMMKMFDDGNLVQRLTELKAKDKNLAMKLWEGFKEIINKLLGVYQSDPGVFYDTEDLMQMKEDFEVLQGMFAEALVEASENFQANLTVSESQTLTEAGIGIDVETGSVYSLNFSTATNDTIQVGKKSFDAEAISQLVAKVTGRSITDARKWVNSEMAIANIVMQNPEFLDFEADNRYEAIKKNSDYPQGTVDLSNLCPKREEFTTMFDMLQKKYPNKLFTAQDVADMRKILSENGITVACGACFVEDRRQLIGEIADTFINMWKEAAETGKPLQKTNAAGNKVELLVTKALAKQYGLTAGTKIMATDTYIPNQYDLTTYEGFKKLEKSHPTIAMAFNRYNNSRGQQSARLIEGRAEYKRQILGWSDAKVRSVNNNGGLRIFSFSDFEVVHLLDLVQVIIDCAAKGVKIQGYTKIPAFAKLVRGTGIKLNRSLIPKGDYGYHMENGKVVLDYDTTEGIDINDKNFMDESDNPNVGNIVIGINPTQIGAAMLDPFIDYIIPFHSNKAKEILRKLGTGEWWNYKESQHEKDIATGTSSKHNVNIYTEVINKYHPTNKVEFVEAFLKECKRQGKIPRYAEFLNVDANGDYAYREGYHKLLVDFKMFDAEGNILPQGNITPNLDENFMKELLNAEIDKKQNYEFPQEVYDAIDKKFGEKNLDNSSTGNENKFTKKQLRGESDGRDDSRRSREMPSDYAEGAKKGMDDGRGVSSGSEGGLPDGRGHTGNAGKIQAAAKWRDLDSSLRNRVKKVVSSQIKNSESSKFIYDYLVSLTGKSDREMTPYLYRKAVEQLTEKLYNSAMNDHPVVFENEWTFMGENTTKLRNAILEATQMDSSGHELYSSQETDADYMDAINRGDMETVQRMVNQTAKSNKYDVEMFHETDADNIHIFDISRGDHGGTDYQTPYGIFTKTSAKNIGLGSKQMALFVKAHNTLRVENRDDVVNKIPGFAKYYDQIQAIDKKYDAISNILEDEEFDALQEWLEEHPDVDMDEVFPLSYIAENKPADIDYPKYLEAHERYVQNRTEWIETYNAVAVKAKAYITDYLRSNGYDSMYFAIDGGSRGRQTDSLIVLDENQVKSADPITYDDDGNIIPLSQRFNSGNDDIRYSTQETDNISNRDMLANAFETLAQNSEEYKMIQKYKNHIRLLNEYEDKLSKLNAEIYKMTFGNDGNRDSKKLRELQAKAKEIAGNINRHDKELLNLEASEPLRKVIQQERKKEAQKTREHIGEIMQNKKARAEQTEYRHKIRRVIRDLNKILKNGNKKQNVKEDMKGFVSKALELADYLFQDHVSNDDLIRKGITVPMRGNEAKLVKETEEILNKLYDEADSLTDEEFTRLDAKRKRNLEKLRGLLTEQRNERLQTPVYKLFDDLVTEYASLKNSSQESVKAAYDPNVERFLRSYIGETDGETDSNRKTLLQNMRVADMTTDELWKLYNAYTMVLKSVRDANKLHVKGRTESIDQMVTQIITDFGKHNIPDKKLAIVARNISNKIGWDYEKLYYALDRIGSNAFTELIMNLANSENIVMRDVIEAAEFRDQIVEKYGFNNWDVNKEIDKEFLDNTGKKFKLTLGQLMSLYAYSRRDGAWDHIEYGGFAFGKAALTNPKPADSYKLSKEQCMAITNTLTKEQKAYVEDMQKFLSETMGAKGNEVSMELYGIKMFNEKNYFPIHIAGDFKPQAKESQAKAEQGFQSMSNAGFTHAQNPNAKAPFVLEDFNDIWADHVNEMSRYHGTVPALEDIRRVMNRSSYSETTTDSTSVKVIMKNHFGEEAVAYFDNLYREANSGAIRDKLEEKTRKRLSLFRKNSVAYKASVLVQQPTSIIRAYSMIDKKYFGFHGLGTITSGVVKTVADKLKWTNAQTNAYNEMLKYAPGVTMAKDIGGFDTATGGSIRSYLLDTGKSFKQKMKTENLKGKGKAVMDLVDDNAIANLPNVADKIAWIEIWNACKRETAANHKDLATSSDEFMQIVGERFTEVIRATQVYDSIFSKSPMLKSKHGVVQYLVSFMSEPNTVANMAESAVRDAIRGDWKSGAKKAVVIVYAALVADLVKSIIYAMDDDDEDETYAEKYIEALVGSLVNDFNPLSYIPFVRDISSALQGYDIERPDMAIIVDAIEALQTRHNYANKDTENMTEAQIAELEKNLDTATWNVVYSVASLLRIPVKNIRKDVLGIYNTVFNKAEMDTTMLSLTHTFEEALNDSKYFFLRDESKSKSDKLYEAIINGDTAYRDRMKDTYKDEDAYHKAVRKALRENDPRIHEAARARYEGKTEEYKRIFRETQNEGNFSFDDIMSAVNSEETKIRNGVEPDKATSSYSTGGFVEAIILGDKSSANAMKQDIISTYIANGKTKEVAEKEFKSDVASSVRDAYSSGLLNEARAKKMLQEYAGKDEEEATSKVNYWVFCEKHPKYEDLFNEARVAKYNKYAKPAGISVDMYAKYINGTKDLSTRNQVVNFIHSLPLTRKQKDALYLAADYAESKIWDVPW